MASVKWHTAHHRPDSPAHLAMGRRVCTACGGSVPHQIVDPATGRCQSYGRSGEECQAKALDLLEDAELDSDLPLTGAERARANAHDEPGFRANRVLARYGPDDE